MTLLAGYGARAASPFRHAACALHDPSLGGHAECQAASRLVVVDGLVSVTHKAWFSSPGADDHDRAAQ